MYSIVTNGTYLNKILILSDSSQTIQTTFINESDIFLTSSQCFITLITVLFSFSFEGTDWCLRDHECNDSNTLQSQLDPILLQTMGTKWKYPVETTSDGIDYNAWQFIEGISWYFNELEFSSDPTFGHFAMDIKHERVIHVPCNTVCDYTVRFKTVMSSKFTEKTLDSSFERKTFISLYFPFLQLLIWML